MKDSAYWMREVARLALALGIAEHYRSKNPEDDHAVAYAAARRVEYKHAVQMYTNPFNVEKGKQ